MGPMGAAGGGGHCVKWFSSTPESGGGGTELALVHFKWIVSHIRGKECSLEVVSVFKNAYSLQICHLM